MILWLLSVRLPSPSNRRSLFCLVARKPGAIPLTLTPVFESYTLSHWVKFVTEDFAPLYAGIFVSGVYAFMDEILMTVACSFVAMSLPKTWDGISVPRKLSLNTKSMPSVSSSKKSLTFGSSILSVSRYSSSVDADGLLPPAPFTRMSHVPNLSLIPLLAASTEVLSVTSQLMPTASPPSLLISSRSEEHTSELQSRGHLVCPLLPPSLLSFPTRRSSDLVDLVCIKVFIVSRCGWIVTPCTVYENVACAESFTDPASCRFDRSLVRHITADADRFAAIPSDFFRNRFAVFESASENRNLRPGPGKGFAEMGAEYSAATCDDCRLS